MSATALFVTGLTTGAIAGGASCAAVQGGLLAGAVGRRRAREGAAPPIPPSDAGQQNGQRPVEPDAPQGGGSRAGASGGATTLTATHPEVSPPRSGRLGWARAGAADSAGPVGAFLAAKLVSHTILGAVLGAVGAAAEPGPRTRAYLLLAAATLMVLFALDLLGVKAVHRLVPRPPQAWTRQVRRSSKSTSVATPALLGFSTVLLPCGVTLSVSLLAITSSSPVAGAAVMAGFVLGTAPLFVLLGFLLRQSTRILQGRLSIVTGVVVLAVAAWTANSALKLGGWGPQSDGGTISAAASAAAVRTLPDGVQAVTVQVRGSGYSPAAVSATPGVPTRLILETDDTGGCTRSFVIPDRNVQQVLPETGRTVVELGTSQAGTLRYTCGMGMYTGRIEFRPAAATAPQPGGAATAGVVGGNVAGEPARSGSVQGTGAGRAATVTKKAPKKAAGTSPKKPEGKSSQRAGEHRNHGASGKGARS